MSSLGPWVRVVDFLERCMGCIEMAVVVLFLDTSRKQKSRGIRCHDFSALADSETAFEYLIVPASAD